MSPCGMATDVRPSLSFQRAIHGPGVDDWTWGRWYWCRDGALDLGRWTAYGHPGWETEVGTRFTGAEFQIQVGRRPRGNLAEQRKAATHLRVERYAASRVSPFPGRESHGRDEWYESGLPAAARFTGDEVRQCGALIWQTDVPVSPPDVESEGGAVVALSGGGEGGGGMVINGPCPFFYGSCLHMAGGGEGGGVSELMEGESLAMEGGGEGGGVSELMEGESLAMEGGGEGGGEMEAFTPPPPSIVEVTGTDVTTTSPIVVDLGATSNVGDLVVVVVANQGGTSISVPAGWNSLTAGTTAGFSWPFAVFYKTRDGGLGSTVSVTFSGGGNSVAAAAVVADAGEVVNGTVVDGDSTVVEHPDYIGVFPGSLAIVTTLYRASVAVDGTLLDFTLQLDGTLTDGTPIVWSKEDIQDDDLTALKFDVTDAEEHVVSLVLVEPAIP